MTSQGNCGRASWEGIWGPLSLTNKKSYAIWGEGEGWVSYPPFYGATHLSMELVGCESGHVAYSMIGC
nr:MAG TPA: hypothetical protein [Caudoviricetes sp.]